MHVQVLLGLCGSGGAQGALLCGHSGSCWNHLKVRPGDSFLSCLLHVVGNIQLLKVVGCMRGPHVSRTPQVKNGCHTTAALV